MKSDKTIIIKKADRNAGIVIMNKCDYSQKSIKSLQILILILYWTQITLLTLNSKLIKYFKTLIKQIISQKQFKNLANFIT